MTVLSNFLFRPTVRTILDRSLSADSLVAPTLRSWSADLYTRRPGPALLEDGALKPTDLDLACFLAALVERGAVINLPTYERRRPETARSNEHVVSAENRHGKVTGLIANRHAFSFSVRIFDANVIVAGAADGSTQDSVGAFRNFMLVDIDGTWHDGWKRIQFLPSAKENSFFEDKKLWTGNSVIFQHFVHPNRWVSFYGTPYLQLKLLIQRLEEECTWYRAQHKERRADGPSDEQGDGSSHVRSERGPSVTEMVDAFEAIVDAPWSGEFPALPKRSKDVLHTSEARIHSLQYTLLPQLRFAARATELAFYNGGMMAKGFPSWVEEADWEIGYKEKGKRTQWNRLTMIEDVFLRYRVYTKSEAVAP